ncbi:MAG: hypothetical protein WKG06_23360 [Segetibacter sp.]
MFRNAFALAWYQPADVPYAITVVGVDFFRFCMFKVRFFAAISNADERIATQR